MVVLAEPAGQVAEIAGHRRGGGLRPADEDALEFGRGEAAQPPTSSHACARKSNLRARASDSYRDAVTVEYPELDARFGEQGGQLTYGTYLRLADLLAAQVPESDPAAHDELLFITIHQVYELWFKLLLSELTDARDRMLAGETYLPRVRLARCRSIEQVLVTQVDVIDSMTPQDFVVFRNKLAPASGFQSSQFREIEFLSGLKDPGFLRRFRGLGPEEEARLRRRLDEPSLWDGFLAVLAAAGFAVDSRRTRAASLLKIASRPGSVRPAVGPGRGADRSRPGVVAVAGPARADGRAADRHEARHRRQRRRAVPALAGRAALLPRAVGAAQPAVNPGARTVSRIRATRPAGQVDAGLAHVASPFDRCGEA